MPKFDVGGLNRLPFAKGGCQPFADRGLRKRKWERGGWVGQAFRLTRINRSLETFDRLIRFDLFVAGWIESARGLIVTRVTGRA